MGERKRQTSVKPKILFYYDQIFQGIDPSNGRTEFWKNEFFLLWTHVSEIEKRFAGLSGQKLLNLKPTFNNLIYNCICMVRDDQHIKAVNAIQTLRGIINGLSTKSKGGLGDDLIDVFCSLDKAESLLQILLDRLCQFLADEYPKILKELSLDFLLVIATRCKYDSYVPSSFCLFVLVSSGRMSVRSKSAGMRGRRYGGRGQRRCRGRRSTSDTRSTIVEPDPMRPMMLSVTGYDHHARIGHQLINQHQQEHWGADVELQLNGERALVHSAVVAAHSNLLCRTLEQEEPPLTVNLSKFKLDTQALAKIIDFMYEGRIHVTFKTIAPLLHAAATLEVLELVPLLESYIARFKDIISYRLRHHVLCKAADYFQIIRKTYILKLDIDALVALLSMDQVNAAREADVFETAIDWLTANPERRVYADQVFGCVRFGLMPTDQKLSCCKYARKTGLDLSYTLEPLMAEADWHKTCTEARHPSMTALMMNKRKYTYDTKDEGRGQTNITGEAIPLTQMGELKELQSDKSELDVSMTKSPQPSHTTLFTPKRRATRRSSNSSIASSGQSPSSRLKPKSPLTQSERIRKYTVTPAASVTRQTKMDMGKIGRRSMSQPAPKTFVTRKTTAIHDLYGRVKVDEDSFEDKMEKFESEVDDEYPDLPLKQPIVTASASVSQDKYGRLVIREKSPDSKSPSKTLSPMGSLRRDKYGRLVIRPPKSTSTKSTDNEQELRRYAQVFVTPSQKVINTYEKGEQSRSPQTNAYIELPQQSTPRKVLYKPIQRQVQTDKDSYGRDVMREIELHPTESEVELNEYQNLPPIQELRSGQYGQRAPFVQRDHRGREIMYDEMNTYQQVPLPQTAETQPLPKLPRLVDTSKKAQRQVTSESDRLKQSAVHESFHTDQTQGAKSPSLTESTEDVESEYCFKKQSADNINQNRFLEYLLLNSVFEPIAQLLGNPAFRQNYGNGAVLLLTLLVNYRKYDEVNPYIVKLSILDDELALNGFSYVISTSLSDHNFKFNQHLSVSEPKGMLSSFTSVVGNMFVAEEVVLDSVKCDESLLLAMYEAVHLNRNFITTLTNLPTESNGEVKTSATADGNQALDSACPTNLLVAFFTYCSVIMQDLKSERSRNAAKLCAIVLTCVTEDQYANTLMHDVNMSFRVPLYRAPMRHRKGAFDKSLPLRPLACTVLDLCVEFIMSHMMRNLPFELYMWILGAIHRILCHEKKCRVRLQYEWRTLWNALISLLHFVVNSETLLSVNCNIFPLCQKVVTLLNLFITFGDTFLPSPTTYDHLYYEIIRQAVTFNNLYSMVLRYVNSENSFKDAAGRLANQLINIRSIISHFQPKIEHLGLTTLSEDEVLTVVRANYDTLTLKLYENLDLVERYNEKPRESVFFVNLVKLIVAGTRSKIRLKQLDHQVVIDQLSTIN